jgi:hypothetical protein
MSVGTVWHHVHRPVFARKRKTERELTHVFVASVYHKNLSKMKVFKRASLCPVGDGNGGLEG